eukprot:TRINITY_DN16252_c0_g1_i2.p1 TRINITY_DN16252_c0_g1~~TRINITY_DN16252_c0_g1_i2.p1  ORF type:complete len:108 (+),score=25.15 TRINITY_DN16252_c0_g1_i2:131-454(+)
MLSKVIQFIKTSLSLSLSLRFYHPQGCFPQSLSSLSQILSSTRVFSPKFVLSLSDSFIHKGVFPKVCPLSLRFFHQQGCIPVPQNLSSPLSHHLLKGIIGPTLETKI